MGDLSEHFSGLEFECRHCHTLPWYGIDPVLVQVLERIRSGIGRPLRIVSGYRCDEHNAAIGGARRSMHTQARAADLPYGLVSIDLARESNAAGIGTRGRWATHVDVRWQKHVTIWRYD